MGQGCSYCSPHAETQCKSRSYIIREGSLRDLSPAEHRRSVDIHCGHSTPLIDIEKDRVLIEFVDPSTLFIGWLQLDRRFLEGIVDGKASVPVQDGEFSLQLWK